MCIIDLLRSIDNSSVEIIINTLNDLLFLYKWVLEYVVWDVAHIRPQLITVCRVTWSTWPAGARDPTRSPQLFHSSEEIFFFQTPGKQTHLTISKQTGNYIVFLPQKRWKFITFKDRLWRKKHRKAEHQTFIRLSSSSFFCCCCCC